MSDGSRRIILSDGSRRIIISSDHFGNAGNNNMSIHISFILTAIISHGSVPIRTL